MAKLRDIEELRKELAKPETMHLAKYTLEFDGTYSCILKLETPIERPTWDSSYYATWGAAKKGLIKYFKEYKSDYDYAMKQARKMKKSDAINEGDL